MSVDLELRKTKTNLENWHDKLEFDEMNWDTPDADIKDSAVFWWNGHHNLNIQVLMEGIAKKHNPNFHGVIEEMFLTDDDLEELEDHLDDIERWYKESKGCIEAIKKAKKEGYNIYYKRT